MDEEKRVLMNKRVEVEKMEALKDQTLRQVHDVSQNITLLTVFFLFVAQIRPQVDSAQDRRNSGLHCCSIARKFGHQNKRWGKTRHV